MKREKYNEEFRRSVGFSALEDSESLKSVGDKFGVPLYLVMNWKVKFASGEEILVPSTKMQLSAAVESVFKDNNSLEAFETIVLADWQDIQAECEKDGEEMDYIVELALEGLTKDLSVSKSLADRAAEYWLDLKDVNGSEPFEIKVRCAEFLAALNINNNISNIDLQSLASSDNWIDRLVAGWTIRDRDDDFAISTKNILCDDLFEDDNGNLLVRESIGDYND